LHWKLKVNIISEISKVYIGFVSRNKRVRYTRLGNFPWRQPTGFPPRPTSTRGLSSVEKRSIFCLLQRKLKINILEKNKTRLFAVEKLKYV
jgi:hypothetical protein